MMDLSDFWRVHWQATDTLQTHYCWKTFNNILPTNSAFVIYFDILRLYPSPGELYGVRGSCGPRLVSLGHGALRPAGAVPQVTRADRASPFRTWLGSAWLAMQRKKQQCHRKISPTLYSKCARFQSTTCKAPSPGGTSETSHLFERMDTR